MSCLFECVHQHLNSEGTRIYTDNEEMKETRGDGDEHSVQFPVNKKEKQRLFCLNTEGNKRKLR